VSGAGAKPDKEEHMTENYLQVPKKPPDTPEYRAQREAFRKMRAAEDEAGGYVVDQQTGWVVGEVAPTPAQLAAVHRAAARFAIAAIAQARYMRSLRRPAAPAPRTMRPTASKVVARRGTTTRRARTASSGRSPDDDGSSEPPPFRHGQPGSREVALAQVAA
jgi:hypothetical protein